MMQPESGGLTPEQIVEISGEIIVLQSKQKDLEERVEELKAKLAEDLAEGKLSVGDYELNIYTGARYDESYGKKVAPELWEKYAEAKKTLPSALAKAKLSPDDYAKFQKPNSKTTVTVGLREE